MGGVMGCERNDTTVANMYNYITVPTTNVRCCTSMMHCTLNVYPSHYHRYAFFPAVLVLKTMIVFLCAAQAPMTTV